MEKTTSVKIDEKLFSEFKIKGVLTKFTLHDLVEKSMWLFVNDEEFRKKMLIFNKDINDTQKNNPFNM